MQNIRNNGEMPAPFRRVKKVNLLLSSVWIHQNFFLIFFFRVQRKKKKGPGHAAKVVVCPPVQFPLQEPAAIRLHRGPKREAPLQRALMHRKTSLHPAYVTRPAACNYCQHEAYHLGPDGT